MSHNSSTGLKYQFKLTPFASEWAHMNSSFFFKYIYVSQHKNRISQIVFGPTQTNGAGFKDIFRLTEEQIVKPTFDRNRDYDPALLYQQIQQNNRNIAQGQTKNLEQHIKNICQASDHALLQKANNSLSAFAHRTYAVVRGFGLAGFTKRPEIAHERLQHAAQAGDDMSALILLRAYATGNGEFIGVKQKDDNALGQLFRKVCENHARKTSKTPYPGRQSDMLGMLITSQTLCSGQNLQKTLCHRDAPSPLQTCVAESEIGVVASNVPLFRDYLVQQGLKL